MPSKYDYVGYVILYIIMVTYIGVYLWTFSRRLVYRVLLDTLTKQKPKANTSSNNHLIMRLLEWKNADSYITYASLCLALAGECFLYKTTPIPEISMQWAIILTAFLLIGNFIKQCILKYRVDHNLYGTCYSEAKEIVSFILEWQRKNGNSNGKPPKLVFTKEELDECLQVNGGEEYAG